MFRKPTTLILGAGASAEVGLPIGEGLARQISNKMDIRFPDGYNISGSGDKEIYHILKQIDPRNSNVMLHAMWAIKNGIVLSDSIDSFLDRHQQNNEITIAGKLGIVKAIADAEKTSLLYKSVENFSNDMEIDFSKIEHTWFVRFFRIVAQGVTKENIHRIFENLTVIVFNYDRCLEHFMVRALVNGYELSEIDAIRILQTLKIIHPYGILSKNIEHFGRPPFNLIESANLIKTYNEQFESKITINEIKDAIQNSTTIIFLGFAFHDPNMKILTVNAHDNVEQVYATTFGASVADRKIIEQLLDKMLPHRSSSPYIDLFAGTCSQFLSEYQRTLSSA